MKMLKPGWCSFFLFCMFICMFLGFIASTFMTRCDHQNVRDNDNLSLQDKMWLLFVEHLKKNGIKEKYIFGSIREDGLFNLSLVDSSISNLNILREIPFKELNLAKTKITDLTPLSLCQTLRRLDIIDTKVSDLSPLSKLPLDILEIGSTDVRDLSPITNMPLRVLHVFPTSITNLDIIFQTDIRNLTFDPNSFSNEQIKKLRNSKIEIINCYPKERFWREYDNGLWGKKP